MCDDGMDVDNLVFAGLNNGQVLNNSGCLWAL